jgi:outer membrane protein assembly factor BamA
MATLERSVQLLLSLFVVLSASVAQAQAPAPGPTRFVEDVLVEGTSNESLQRIVASEARIDTGRDVTDTEIRDAARRVRRLPFVIDVQPALRRGSVPGRYVLVFEVVADATLLVDAELWANDALDVGHATGSIGADRFLGKGWRVFGSAGTFGAWAPTGDQPADDVSLLVGFERYGLLGEGSRLQLSLDTSIDDIDDGALGAASALVVPVARNQSLRFDLDALHNRARLVQDPDTVLRSDSVSLSGSWLYETTDDPIAPRTGTEVQARLHLVSFSRLEARGFDPSRWTWFNILQLDAERSFPVWRGLSLAPRLQTSHQVSRLLSASTQAGAVARYVVAGRRNSYRAAIEAGGHVSTFFSGYGRGHVSQPEWSASLGLSVRTRFGLVRLEYTPSWFQEGPATK